MCAIFYTCSYSHHLKVNLKHSLKSDPYDETVSIYTNETTYSTKTIKESFRPSFHTQDFFSPQQKTSKRVTCNNTILSMRQIRIKLLLVTYMYMTAPTTHTTLWLLYRIAEP